MFDPSWDSAMKRMGFGNDDTEPVDGECTACGGSGIMTGDKTAPPDSILRCDVPCPECCDRAMNDTEIRVEPSESTPGYWYWAFLIDGGVYADGEAADEEEARYKACANRGEWEEINR